MAHRPTVASWAPFCISYPVFAMLESMRDFLELVALRFFSHLGEEPLGNHFSILRKKTAQPPDTPGSPEGNTEGPGTASSDQSLYHWTTGSP